MNIVLIMPNVFPVPATKGGAVETLATNLLLENEKSGKIHFICFSVYEEEAFRFSQNYQYTEFIYIDEKRENKDLTFVSDDKNFIHYMDKIYEHLKEIRYDFVIVEGGNVAGYEYLLKKLPKEKCLVHFHGSGKEANNVVMTQVYDKYIAISQYQKNVVLKNAQIAEADVNVLYNAVNLEEFDKQISEEEKNALRQKYHIENNDVVIMYVGRTIPKKGVKELLLAFKQLKNIAKSKMMIVGSANFDAKTKTDYEAELEKIVADIPDKIIFTGYIANQDLYKLQNIADIAIVPSIWEEPFGLVVVENMAAGLPLVVTKMGGIPEIVNHQSAFIVENDENLITNLSQKLDVLIENPDMRDQMGKAGKERAKLFSSEKYFENFYQFIQKIKSN